MGAEAAWYQASGRVGPRNGPLASPDELGLVRGFDGTALTVLLPAVTLDANVLNVNSASRDVLEAASGLPPAATALLMGRRRMALRSGILTN